MALKSFFLSVVLACSVPLSASASLGGDLQSVQSDRVQMNAALQTTPAALYTVFEIQMPSGTVVREFVSPDGVVFAVVWQGPSLPDLRQLLGSHFAQFARADGGGAGPRVIEQPGLMLYAGGRMRAFLGRALVPGLVPKGVSLEDIR
jgi:uncharacterized protein DUF2844